MGLEERKCVPCEGGMEPWKEDQIQEALKELDGWELKENKITKNFSFRNYYETLSFVNAVAWLANQENHHPDLFVTYKNCRVDYYTHAIGGISENDLICAAKVNQLLK